MYAALVLQACEDSGYAIYGIQPKKPEDTAVRLMGPVAAFTTVDDAVEYLRSHIVNAAPKPAEERSLHEQVDASRQRHG